MQVNRHCLERVRLSIPYDKGERVVLCQALPGYGKTVLLAQHGLAHIQRYNATVVWLSLASTGSSEDALVKALWEQISPTPALEILNQQPPLDLETLGSHLWMITEHNETPILICIDDAEDRLIHFENFEEFVLSTPECVYFSIASAQKLPFTRLRLRHVLIELNGQDLALTEEELMCWGAHHPTCAGLVREQWHDIQVMTDGWAALCVLVSMNYRPADTILEYSEITHFLNNYVFTLLDDEQYEFLLQVSDFVSLTERLYDHVYKTTQAWRLIEELSQQLLFLSRDKKHQDGYCIQSAIAKHLSRRYQDTAPKERSRSIKRAAYWYWKNKRFQHAISMAILTNDYQWSHRINTDVIVDLALLQGETDSLKSWLFEIPQKELLENPALVILCAWMLYFSQEHERAESLLHHLSVNSNHMHKGWPLLVRAVGYANHDKLFVSETMCQEWLLEFGENNASGKGIALTCLAVNYAISDQVGKFKAILPEAKAHVQPLSQSFAYGWIHIAEILHNIAVGDFSQAEKKMQRIKVDENFQVDDNHFCKRLLLILDFEIKLETQGRSSLNIPIAHVMDFIFSYCFTEVAVSTLFSITAGMISRNDAASAIEYCERMKLHALDKGLTRLVQYCDLEIMDLYQKNYPMPYPINLLNFHDSNISENVRLTHVNRMKIKSALIKIYSLLQDEDFNEAYIHSVTAIKMARRHCDERLLMSVYLSSAAVFFGLERIHEAKKHVAFSIEIMERLGCRYSFRSQAYRLEQVMPKMKKLYTMKSLLTQEESSAEDSSSVVLGAQMGKAEKYNLSTKQIAVLRYIKQGYSNKEIANQLFVSEDTVKWHIRKIFRSLGTSNRTESVAEAEYRHIL